MTDTLWVIFDLFCQLVSSLLGVYCNQRGLVDESGTTRTQMGRLIDQKWYQCVGRFVRYYPHNCKQ
jgi:hypothetical protein